VPDFTADWKLVGRAGACGPGSPVSRPGRVFSSEELAIVYGQNVCSERGDYRPLPEAEVAWDGEGIRTGAGTRVRMFKVTWINPTPAVAVKSIDFYSTRSGSAPHLIAVTIEP
jgi:hypothetical protein